MNASPRVTAIVLNWNGKELSAACLRSLLASDYPALEVILVDNGSSDGSVPALQAEFPDLEIVCSPENLGYAGGNNLGIRLALDRSTPYIFLLNNDTLIDPGCVNRLVEALEADPTAGAANPKILYHRPADRIWYAGGTYSLWTGFTRHRGHRQVDRGQFDRQEVVTFLTGCAFFVRGRVLQEVGLLDESLFNYIEDLDLCLRIRRAGYRLLYVPGGKVWHREGFTAEKELGKPYRYYQSVRNLLVVLRRYARPVQLLSAYPLFLVNVVLRTALMTLLRRDFASTKAVLRGALEAGRMTPPRITRE